MAGLRVEDTGWYPPLALPSYLARPESCPAPVTDPLASFFACGRKSPYGARRCGATGLLRTPEPVVLALPARRAAQRFAGRPR